MNSHPLLAIVDDASFDEHRSLAPHPERPERLHAARRAVRAIASKTTSVAIEARPASDEELARVHSPAYLERLGRLAGSSAHWDADTYLVPRSVEVARRAAGGASELAAALTSGRASRGVALLRPPGHHARPNGAMGFCLLNNVAVAAAHARALGAARVMIVDFDVHHGNGTQEIFYQDPSVLFVSLHQSPFYPGTGGSDERGEADGTGYTVNIPLSAGAGDDDYSAAFSRLVAPIASEFAPNLLLLSAGFDAHANDPLGEMLLSSEGYALITRELARALAPGVPIGVVLEGGYDLDAIEQSLTQTLTAIIEDERPRRARAPSPSSRHGGEIERAERAARRAWHLG